MCVGVPRSEYHYTCGSLRWGRTYLQDQVIRGKKVLIYVSRPLDKVNK